MAGDLLPEATQDQLIASGFNRCNVSTSEGGSINKEWIFRYAVDRTSTAVEVWMGLTAGCAVCHDHKFDPLSTKEFYSLYAFFHSAADPAMDGNIVDTPPIIKLIDEGDKRRVRSLEADLKRLDTELSQRLDALAYEDPALLPNPPEPEEGQVIWFDDGFPADVNAEYSGGPATQLVSADQGPVYSGKLALSRTSDNQISQDFFASGGHFEIPNNGEFFVHCFLDPDNPPEAIMVQFHTSGWNNRAVWGDQEKITFGKPNTTEKVHLGELPETGQWAKLSFQASKLGLKAGTEVTGFAFTQFGGTVNWDQLGVAYRVDKARDPAWSWHVWKQQDYSKIQKALPNLLRRQLQGRTWDEWSDEETKQVRKIWMEQFYAGARELVDEIGSRKAPLQKEIDQIQSASPVTMIMAELKKPRESFVMQRGAYDNPGDRVYRGVPAFLPPLPSKTEGEDYNRLDLANWLLSREHPLTSRVAVNRVWQQFFGTGLVETSADFGSQGQPPSHPELLDWLAVQFIDDDWDMKRLVKRIVTSHSYLQSSFATAENLKRDPGNRLLARGPRLRLEAEVLRDQALFVSGLLVPRIGGPGVKPYQPPNIWEPVGFGNSNTRYYKQDSGDALYRRSLYTFLKRTAPPPFMSTFDAPNREQSCSVRGRSNTPLQALQLMNDIQHVEAARQLATRALREGGDTAEQRIRWLWRVVTAREPTSAEVSIVDETLKQHLTSFAEDDARAAELVSYGESSPDAKLAPAELAAYTMIANLVLNLDETVCKN